MSLIKRAAALAMAGAAFTAVNVAYGPAADAAVITTSCPTNGVEFWIYHSSGGYDSNDYCFAGNPSGGSLNINISNVDAVGSNWNHGYVNYYIGSTPKTLNYYANGVNYSTGSTSSRAVLLVISN